MVILGLAALLRAGGLALRRVPVLVRHGIAVLLLGWFVAWNLAQVWDLRGGKAANSRRRACCRYMPEPYRAIAKPIYDRFGNPFALPASAWLAARYGVPLQRWDVAVGEWADVPLLAEHNAGTYTKRTHTWHLPGLGFTPWIVGGLGGPQTSGKTRFRWTVAPQARVLLPLWLPDARVIQIVVVPNLAADEAPLPVQVAFNGRVRYEGALPPGRHTLRFEVPSSDIVVGTNDLTFRAEPRPHATTARPPPVPPSPVGLAVEEIVLRFPAGAPAG